MVRNFRLWNGLQLSSLIAVTREDLKRSLIRFLPNKRDDFFENSQALTVNSQLLTVMVISVGSI